MTGYKPKGLDGLLERRRRLLLHYEVIAHEISNTNKKIGDVFFESLNNRSIRFKEGNTVTFMNESGDIGVGMPVGILFKIEQVQSANTFDDIIYMVRDVNSGNAVAIRQDEFHSFIFDNEK